MRFFPVTFKRSAAGSAKPGCSGVRGTAAAVCLRLILAAAAVLFVSRSQAGDIITSTLTVTNAANINATNAYNITVNSDTRTWTNSVVDASTQILASTNNATAVQRLLIHFATYQVSGLGLLSDGSTYVSWRTAESAPLTITLSTNTWGVVSYLTNTVGVARGVRIPHTVESTANRELIGDGLVDYLNAATTTQELDQTAAALAQLAGLSNAQTISGAKNFTSTGNIWSGKYLQLTHSALNVDNAATNFVADFTGDAYRTITATNEVNFLQSTNRAAVRTVVIRIDANGADRALTVNTNWHGFGAVHGVVTNGTIGILSATVFGTAETDVHVVYIAQ